MLPRRWSVNGVFLKELLAENDGGDSSLSSIPVRNSAAAALSGDCLDRMVQSSSKWWRRKRLWCSSWKRRQPRVYSGGAPPLGHDRREVSAMGQPEWQLQVVWGFMHSQWGLESGPFGLQFGPFVFWTTFWATPQNIYKRFWNFRGKKKVRQQIWVYRLNLRRLEKWTRYLNRSTILMLATYVVVVTIYIISTWI